ncbi:MAG: alanine racemase [Betaproteobacteria bacterium]|nr:alanine racemase [Betaproteobacteria bacterium]
MRPARALIDLDALRHNYHIAHQRHGGRVFAVVKANAYGHGAVACAQALSPDADGYAVAFLEEAIALRNSGIRRPILLLEGVFSPDELLEAIHHGFWPAVHHPDQIKMIERTDLPAPIHIWLKINSGMNRAGFPPADVQRVWRQLMTCGKVEECGFMSHFARADEPGCDATAQQIRIFDEATKGLSGARSLANSAAILGWPDAHRNWARAGIMLYGADPMPGEDNSLLPVMTLESRVIAVRNIAAGEPVGYGARFVAARPTRVGLVAMGYADGYPRSAPDGTPVAVDNKPTALIGRVSMDMLTIDLTDIPEAGIDSVVELWGRQVSVNKVAQAAGTIAYELLCNVKRVSFVWSKSNNRLSH